MSKKDDKKKKYPPGIEEGYTGPIIPVEPEEFKKSMEQKTEKEMLKEAKEKAKEEGPES